MMFGNYVFNLSPGVFIKTLSHIWGKLNLPTLLFRVGLLTLINMDSFIYLDKWYPSLPPYYCEVVMVNGVVCLVIVMMNG